MSLHIHYVAVILSGDVSLLTLVVDKLTTVVEFWLLLHRYNSRPSRRRRWSCWRCWT